MRFGGLWLGLVWLFAAGELAAQVPATTGVVDGEVVDGVTGTPIANARVKLKKEPEDLYAGVDGEGHFRFAGLAPAGYSLSVESPGFLPATPTYVSLVSDANPEADGLIHAKVTVKLTAYAVITGRVTDPYGMPVEDCQITVDRKSVV